MRNSNKSTILKRWGKWRSELESVLEIGVTPKLNKFFKLLNPIITHSHGSASVVRATKQVNGETQNLTPATPKPRKRSRYKSAHVITSWTPTLLQKLVTFRPDVSSPRMRDFAHQKRVSFFIFWGVLATRYSQGPWTDFDAKYAKTRRSAQRCAFSGLRTQNLISRPHFPELAPFWGPFLTGLRKFSPKNSLTMGMLPLEHLLIVIVDA